MKKNRTRLTPAKGTFGPGRPAPTRQSRLAGVILDARTALRELVWTAGLEVFTEMLEDDRATICGPKHQPMPDRRAYRHGHDEGRLVFGGRKIRVKKPRIRSIEGEEIELGTWRRMADEDPLRDRVVEQILLGVSQRGYERSLEPLPAGAGERGCPLREVGAGRRRSESYAQDARLCSR